MDLSLNLINTSPLFHKTSVLRRMSKRKQADTSMKKIIVDELHKPSRKFFPRRKVVQIGINDTLQIDLVEMLPYESENNGYKYLLTVIDIFSKKAYARPLKSKTGVEVMAAMRSVLNEIGTSPKNIHSDQGKEFFNNTFIKLMKDNKINFYNTYSHLKASIVERFNRTLKEKMWKRFSLQGNYKWINILPDLIKEYNNTVHRTIKMKPNDVRKKHEEVLLGSVYKNIITTPIEKFKVGDPVRISKYKGIFRKGYEPNWSTEIFRILKVHSTQPTTYTLCDSDDKTISGSFYQHELQKVKLPDAYLIEKIIKKKKDKLFVKWLGFDEKFNSWIDKKDFE